MAINQSDKIWLILDNELVEGAPEDLIIAGAFDHLFDTSSVRFNSEEGTFSFRTEEKGTMYVDGEGYKKRWTEKAINRAGFTLSKEKTLPFIITPSETKNYWQLNRHLTHVHEFGSVYELITYLSREVIGPI